MTSDRMVCPVAGFDPFDQAFLRDPHPVLAHARAEVPVFHDQALDAWVVTRYDTIRDIFRDPDRFSATVASEPLRPWCDEAQTIIQGGGVRIPPLLVNNDPPDHQIHRRFLGAPFARPRIRQLGPMVSTVVASQLAPLRAREHFDMVRDVTWEIPVHVLFDFLGVPAEDVATLKRWTASRVRLIWGHPETGEQIALAHSLVEYARYSERFVEHKAHHLGDDYTSDLLRAVGDEQRDPDTVRNEIAVSVFNLLFAGHETTTNMMSNAVRLVLSDRVLWDELRRDPSRAEAIVEEAIRLEPSVTAWRRRTRVDVELDGVAPDRANARDHLSFGFGIHYCLGAQLARMQISELLAQLAVGFPTLALVDDQVLTYVPNTSFRGPEQLLVTQKRASGTAA